MLKNLLRSVAGGDGEASSLPGGQSLAELPPEAADPASLIPILVPAECLSLGWIGPIEPLGALPVAAAWALRTGPHAVLYVSDQQAGFWEERGFDWRVQALRNLIEHYADANAEICDEAGRPFVKVMLNDDGLGPSRLLIPRLFEAELGADYMVAIPEETCAVAYRAELTDAQRADLDLMIGGCFAHGTQPVSPERFAAAQFWTLAERYLG